MPERRTDISPFENCPALDGYHCQTNSLAKIFHFYGHPLSEEMLLGLGAGMGFIYWKMKYEDEDYIFVGGRANNKDFFQDLGTRTGMTITEKETSSEKKARQTLITKLEKGEPAMLFGDMGYMPWFDMPTEYHFGGHTFTVCGWDGGEGLLISDMDQRASGLKEGYYFPVTMAEIARIRNSPHKPFPPKNRYLEFDFSGYHNPGRENIYSAIKQTAESQLNPPIKNVGVKGLRHTAKEILKWPDLLPDYPLRMNLFNFYIFIEIGGTGGGCFRYMYNRFLKEAAKISNNQELVEIGDLFQRSGELLTSIGMLFKDAEHMDGIPAGLEAASRKLNQAADLEAEAFTRCLQSINTI